MKRLGWLLALLILAAAGGYRLGISQSPATSNTPGSAKVTRIVDGDTIHALLAGEDETIRLIGIDTPETRGKGGLRECFGSEATKRVAKLIPPGTEVRVIRDVESRDRYGRLLAYVYRVKDDLFVNLQMAEDGYAAVLTIAPNVAHADEFVAAVRRAREKNLGLWRACDGPDTPIQ